MGACWLVTKIRLYCPNLCTVDNQNPLRVCREFFSKLLGSEGRKQERLAVNTRGHKEGTTIRPHCWMSLSEMRILPVHDRGVNNDALKTSGEALRLGISSISMVWVGVGSFCWFVREWRPAPKSRREVSKNTIQRFSTPAVNSEPEVALTVPSLELKYGRFCEPSSNDLACMGIGNKLMRASRATSGERPLTHDAAATGSG